MLPETTSPTSAVRRRNVLASAAAICANSFVGQLLAEERAPHKTTEPRMNPRLYSFLGGSSGPWKVTAVNAIQGESLAEVGRLDLVAGRPDPLPAGTTWSLHGVTSNERYVTREEKQQLVAKQPQLGRPEADRAVLIPIRKNAAWWALTQDERRQIFEEQSRHNAIGLEYLPAIARRLHHCRDLERAEPFDFLTWFEFASADTTAFDRLVKRLRETKEWTFVDREVEIRLERDNA
jgi:hypothetical protein